MVRRGPVQGSGEQQSVPMTLGNSNALTRPRLVILAAQVVWPSRLIYLHKQPRKPRMICLLPSLLRQDTAFWKRTHRMGWKIIWVLWQAHSGTPAKEARDKEMTLAIPLLTGFLLPPIWPEAGS